MRVGGTLALVVAAVAVAAAALAAFALAGSYSLKWASRLQRQAEEIRPGVWNVTLPRLKGRGPRGWGIAGRGFVQVSTDYENTVLTILRNDPDASKLLQEGFNVTTIKPIITLLVSGTGDVALRAKQALVLLRGPSGFACVLVDVHQGKVIEIVTVTRTVITKS